MNMPKTIMMMLMMGSLVKLAAAQEAAEPPRAAGAQRVQKLLNGRDLSGWRAVDDGYFDRHGKVTVDAQAVHLAAGEPGTGIVWSGDVPRSNYELRLEAKRTAGSDFFCGLTFPVGPAYCTFIVGGWGGGVTGLSNIDDLPAVENETTDYIQFQRDQWYRIRLRVTDERIEAWIDDKRMVNVVREKRRFSIWPEQEPLRPLGIASWMTSASLRNIELERLP